ncbi:preprotein translocase subunit SecY [Salibacteraceae bacterium]|jgi:preprotein translocase subunit SecY|nr:preprotein translocase subunit SecY [Flavobacteriales bacterium]MDC1202414.1 preprotein translocase subunit SecY [Salibacteraceae bacterium]
MKRLIDTFQNIWKIEDLRVRILNTLGLLLIYRLGSFVVLPGVDPGILNEMNSGAQGLAALLNIFAGGAFSRASVFALGIMPYISASIVMQLMGIAVPAIQKMQREGESGRKKITQYTRFLTIAITLFQAPSYISTQIPAQAVVAGDGSLMSFWGLSTVLLLVTGTIFVMWLGERITDKGIGNGISMIIMIGIIAQLPSSFAFEISSRMTGGGFVMLLVEMVFLLLVTIATVALVQGTRRIPVNFAKKVVGNKQYGGARQYIPLKVNAAGVMPIIFAQALMFLPMTLVGFTSSDAATGFASAFADITGFWYNFTFFLLIIAFTYFYTAITVNPNQMAEDLKRNGGFIPGVKPGKKTSEFLDNVLSRITLPGSVFLGLVAILPAFAMIAGVSTGFAYFFGGTSLLIMVGVILDTLQQIESHLLMRHYDGLMKSGKIKGRSNSAFGMAG